MTESTTRTRVRENDRQTSWDAAVAQTRGKVAEVQRHIVECLRRDAMLTAELGDDADQLGMTDRELEAWLPSVAPSSVRTRRHELELAGWVTPLVTTEGIVVKRRSRIGMRWVGGPQVAWRAVADDEDPPERASRGRRGETKHERGLAAARRLGRWEWGADEYADRVLAAYLDPAAAHERLDAEGAPK